MLRAYILTTIDTDYNMEAHAFSSAERIVRYIMDTKLTDCGYFLKNSPTMTSPFEDGPVAVQMLQKVKKGFGISGKTDGVHFQIEQVFVNPPPLSSFGKVY